jgi:uncharacterized protein YrrD
MRKASEIKSLQVFSIQDGANVESVSHLALSPASKKVEFLAFAGTPWFEVPFVIPWSKIKAVGKDMITIKTSKDVSQINEELRKTLAHTVEIIGLPVIDSSGKRGSKVADFTLDEVSGSLLKVMLEDGVVLDAASIVTISGSAVVTEGGELDKPAVSENEFLLGKTVAADIADDKGKVIIAAGTVVTAKEIEAAKAGNVLYDLVTGVKQ